MIATAYTMPRAMLAIRLIEPADLTGFDVGSEVGPVEAEEVDIGEHEQRRRPQGRDLAPNVDRALVERAFGCGHDNPFPLGGSRLSDGEGHSEAGLP